MKYAEKVIEILDFLQTLSRNQKLTICRDRINFLIYLKISQAKTQAQSGRLIGLKEHQSQNLWQIYSTFGLSGQVVLQHLPTACPELNPVERFFKELRKKLSNKIFHSIENAENKVIEAFEKITKSSDDICQLTLFPYIKNTQLNI